MTRPGTPSDPLRVAIVGAGPAGFFLAERLLGQSDVTVEADLYERLPTPYGLVRFGVAPDHEKIKNVTRSFDKVAARPGLRFFGNVDVGRHVTLDDLKHHYHQVCFCTGAQTDRRMGIPGEDLARSHPATEFVAWYNGHPDYRDLHFDLSVERVAVVGVGNVAVDVARILSRSVEEMATTDVADYALEALRASRVKEVYLLGRRGPAQAAFTTPEAKELGELEGADVRTVESELALDPLSLAVLDAEDGPAIRRKIKVLQEYAHRPRTGKPRLLTLRFLVSPTELVADEHGGVRAMRLVRNRLAAAKGGGTRAEPTGEFEELPVGLVFRSVGYRGVAIPGLPFDEKAGTVPHERGRVRDPVAGQPVTGAYVAGWIKRGPSGVVGTNKPDAAETAETMLADLAAGAVLEPAEPAVAAAEALVRRAQPAVIPFGDWRKLDRLETERGKALGRPRLKFTKVEEMLAQLGRS
ncbi:MAG: FAD-dependent oxidoreductase [Gemmatimonadota bacterium]